MALACARSRGSARRIASFGRPRLESTPWITTGRGRRGRLDRRRRCGSGRTAEHPRRAEGSLPPLADVRGERSRFTLSRLYRLRIWPVVETASNYGAQTPRSGWNVIGEPRLQRFVPGRSGAAWWPLSGAPRALLVRLSGGSGYPRTCVPARARTPEEERYGADVGSARHAGSQNRGVPSPASCRRRPHAVLRLPSECPHVRRKDVDPTSRPRYRASNSGHQAGRNG